MRFFRLEFFCYIMFVWHLYKYMGDVIRPNFGGKKEIKPDVIKSTESRPANLVLANRPRLNPDKLPRIRKLLQANRPEDALRESGLDSVDKLMSQVLDIALEGYGLERHKVDLIKSFKSQVSERKVVETFTSLGYSEREAVSAITNSEYSFIKKKPAFFLALLMKLRLY